MPDYPPDPVTGLVPLEALEALEADDLVEFLWRSPACDDFRRVRLGPYESWSLPRVEWYMVEHDPGFLAAVADAYAVYRAGFPMERFGDFREAMARVVRGLIYRNYTLPGFLIAKLVPGPFPLSETATMTMAIDCIEGVADRALESQMYPFLPTAN